MMILELFRWWYGQGWRQVVDSALERMRAIAEDFSVGTLIRTLFAPWRRIMTYPGAGLDAHLRAMLDNLVSRCVGFTVRICVLLAIFVMGSLALVIGLLQILIWPLIPAVIVASIIKGVS